MVIKKCIKCKKEKKHYAKGLCAACYQKYWIRTPKICSVCGELKPYQAKCMCSRCYNKINRDNDTEKYKERVALYRKNNGGLLASENKDCSSYLGCIISEDILSKVFKDVIRMPYGNIGFDFLCAKNKKIDVKSSVCHITSGKSDHWNFGFNKNKIADYFLCIAFDNRKDLNPLYMWLLPSELVNHLTGTSISLVTISKWDAYRYPIDNVIKCCNIKRNKY